MSDQQQPPNEPTTPESPQSEPPPAPDGQAPTKDECNLALVAHMLGIILSIVGPLIVWLIKKDSSKFVDDQGKEAINFQILIVIGLVIAIITTPIGIGCVIFPLVWIFNLVFCIIAGVSASKGERYRYPLAIRLLK